jgi:hypothetical protein
LEVSHQQPIEGEVWASVEDPEYSHYEVSDHGRVRNTQRPTAGPMRLTTTLHGYKSITLQNPQRNRMYTVHELVASAFIGPRPPDPIEVNHKDKDRANNRATNLEWMNRRGQMVHASGKPVDQLDAKGGMVKRWPCVADIERQFGLWQGQIQAVSIKRGELVAGFLWRWAPPVPVPAHPQSADLSAAAVPPPPRRVPQRPRFARQSPR